MHGHSPNPCLSPHDHLDHLGRVLADDPPQACAPCPIGANCTHMSRQLDGGGGGGGGGGGAEMVGVVLVRDRIVAKPGYANATPTTGLAWLDDPIFRRCPWDGGNNCKYLNKGCVCTGGAHDPAMFMARNRSRCEAGHRGRLCMECDAGWARVRKGCRECNRYPVSDKWVTFGALALFSFVAITQPGIIL